MGLKSEAIEALAGINLHNNEDDAAWILSPMHCPKSDMTSIN